MLEMGKRFGGKRRRLTVGLLALSMLASGITLVDPGPAYAGLFNPIPADFSGDPQDQFVDDDGLFAYTTSDIQGGRICIVNDEVTLATAGDFPCNSPAWGSANTVVGIGTQYTLVEGPTLHLGTWRLITENTIGDATGLSIPFTVRACPDCDGSIAGSAVQAFKASFGEMAFATDLVCTVWQTYDVVSDIEGAAGEISVAHGKVMDLTKRADAYESGAADFLGTVFPIAGGAVAGGIAFPSASTAITIGEEKAKAILQQLVCALEKMYSDIEADPPDLGYIEVDEPSFRPIDPLGTDVDDVLAESLDRQMAFSTSILHALERYQGALQDSNVPGVHRQTAALAANTTALIQELRDGADAFRAYADQIELGTELTGPIVASADVRLSLANVYARVRTSGFTAAELQELDDLGFDAGDIEAIRSHFALDPGIIPLDATIPSVARDTADALEAAIPALDMLAREAAAVAGRTNSAPTAAFTPSAQTGVVPLTVDFINDSTDADGDDLTYEWTFGDGDTSTDESPQHTYTGTGGYVARLTVSDGTSTATAQQTVIVSDGRPEAFYVAHPLKGFVPFPVAFDASGSTTPEAPITSWEWDFGDGTTASGEEVGHTYTQPGNYLAVVTVTNDVGSRAYGAFVRVLDEADLDLPLCGDQDDPEDPIVINCPDYASLPGIQAFTLAGTGPVDVTFDYVFQGAIFESGLNVFPADDQLGTVDGLAPEDSGYYHAAMLRATTIFPRGSNASVPDRTIEFDGGDVLVFFINPGYDLDILRESPDEFVRNNAFFSMDRLNGDDTRHVFGFRSLVDDGIEFGFEDLTGGGDFDYDDVVFTASAPFTALSPVSTSKVADAAESEPGGSNGYEITLTNALPVDVEIDAITDTLPAGFTYVTGSTSGITGDDPQIAGQVLTWDGPFALGGLDSVVLHFEVTVATAPGTYWNEATGEASLPVAATGRTAPVVISGGGGEGNHAPTLELITDQVVDELVQLQVQANADDEDADALGFSLGATCPTGSSINATSGAFTWTPTEAQGPGTFTCTVVVTDDGAPVMTASRSFSIQVAEINRDPSLDAITDATVHPGDAVSRTAVATDPDLPANTLGYSKTSGPGTLNSTTGAFAWTPTLADLGDHTVTIGVSDGRGGTDSVAFVIHVVREPTSLIVGGASGGQYSDGATISATLTSNGSPVSDKSLTLSLGSSSQSATTNASGVAQATFSTPGPAGSISRGATFAGTGTYAPASASGTFVVAREDAWLEYAGDTTATAGANVTLRATAYDSAAALYTGPQPEPGGTIGDITRMRVAFDIYAAATCLTGSPVATIAAAVVDTGTAGDGVGSATATWNNVGEGSYCVVPRLIGATTSNPNGYYAAPPALPGGLGVYRPASGHATGGGWIQLDTGRAAFGFNAKVDRNGAKGQLVLMLRTTYGGRPAILMFKSNVFESFTVDGRSFPIAGVLKGRGTIRYIAADSGATLFESGNAAWTVSIVDGGSNRTDSFGTRILDKVGAIVADLALTALAGGSVVIHEK